MRQRFLVAIGLVFVLWAKVASATDESSFSVLRDVVYTEQAGEKLTADIYQPVGEGPFPGVLVVHGGAWMSGEKSQLSPVAARLAKNGYTSMAINYRLAPKHPFPAQIEDCRAAVRFMRSDATKYKIDPQRIGGYGYSAGGHLVALLGVSVSNKDQDSETPHPISTCLQAVVAGGAPLDFRVIEPHSRMLAYWLGGTRDEKPELYAEASPAHFVSAGDAPIFFFHGEQDKIVPILSPQAMQPLLQAANVENDLYTVPEAGHIAAVFDKQAWLKSLAFLDRQLKAKLPVTEPADEVLAK